MLNRANTINSIKQELIGSLGSLLPLPFWIKNKDNGQLLVLCYHNLIQDVQKPRSCNDYYFINIPVNIFEKQILWVMKHFDFVHLDDLLSGCHLPQNAAIITFDDGFKSTYTHALPILHKLKIPATVFLTGNHIENETVPWIAHLHDLLDQASLEDRILFYQGETFRLASFSHKIKLLKKLKQKFKALTYQVINKAIITLEQDLDISILPQSIKESFMNYDEIVNLGKHNWTIGNHTYHHLNLKHLDKNTTKREIESAREILKKFGHYRDVLALPFGGNSSYSKETIQAAKETGMKLMFTTKGTNNYKKRNSIVNRIICETYSFRYFLFNVTGKKEAFSQLFSQKVA